MYVRHHTVKQVTASSMAANPDEGEASIDATSVAKYGVGEATPEESSAASVLVICVGDRSGESFSSLS